MSVVLINYPLETFTPTQSGAISVWIWECCRTAESVEPVVITRRSAAASYDWRRTIFVDYPPIPADGWRGKMFRIQRKFTGWRHLGQRMYARRVWEAIRRNRLEEIPLVLMNDPETAIYLRYKMPRAKIIHWFHNQLEAPVWIRRAFAGAVDASVAVSNFTARWNERHYGLPADAIRTIYNGVDADRFRPAPIRCNGIPVINFLGRTGIEKAPDLLLRSASRLAEKAIQFSIQLLGSNHWDRFEEDDYQREITSLCADLHQRGIKVKRPGHVSRNDLPGELQKAAINVVPSRWEEPFGLSTIEGMASGLASVASATGGTPEVVSDAGLLFKSDSVEELAGHLESLLTTRGRLEDYARRARNRACEFSWNKTWSGLCDVAAAIA
jgi:glycosyltransferase involved in cell wall biosynthesis